MGEIDLFSQFPIVHGLLQTFAWFVLENILLWAQHFKYYSCSIYVHIICAIIIGLITVCGSLLMLIPLGISILSNGYHYKFGFIVLILMPFILTSGLLCRLNKTSPTVSPTLVTISNKAHTIFGWIIIIAAKITLYLRLCYLLKYYCILVFTLDLFSHLIFLYLKYFNKKLGAKSISDEFRDPSVRKVTSRNDLRMYGNNYFMFANYIYSTDLLIGQHPGGWQIINKARGRDVDRFVYGSEPLEAFEDIGSVSHSANSLNLAGDPIARLEVPSAYQNMGELNEVTYSSIIMLHPKIDVLLVYLQGAYSQNLRYRGYEYINQLGQYFALTAGRNITRLYTQVNFLQKHNLQLMKNIDQKSFLKINECELTTDNHNKNLIPLLIKKYEDGHFTQKYLELELDKQLLLSRPRGFGFSLQDRKPGKIVLVSGGTGLNPYCDLIDLIYKDLLLSSNHPLSNIIRHNDPLLTQSPFANFQFVIYAAVDSIDEIHPLILHQLEQLSASRQLICSIKFKYGNVYQFTKLHPNIKRVNEYFEHYLKSQLRDNNLSHIYICGPTAMTKSINKILQHFQLVPDMYTIM